MKKAETSEEDKIGQMKDKMRTYVRLAVAEKLGTFSQGYYQCNCFAVYLRLSGHKSIVGQAAKQILSELVWDDCPDPRCPECSDALYSEIQKWRDIRVVPLETLLEERKKFGKELLEDTIGPEENVRKAHCKLCGAILLPGEGTGFEILASDGCSRSKYYACKVCYSELEGYLMVAIGFGVKTENK